MQDNITAANCNHHQRYSNLHSTK